VSTALGVVDPDFVNIEVDVVKARMARMARMKQVREIELREIWCPKSHKESKMLSGAR
jgi:hypothetical protein